MQGQMMTTKKEKKSALKIGVEKNKAALWNQAQLQERKGGREMVGGDDDRAN